MAAKKSCQLIVQPAPDRDVLQVCARNNARRVLSGLNHQRQEGWLCDVVLSVSGRSLPAHRGVLAEHSQYFRAMFSSGMLETTQRHVEVHGLEPSAVEQLISFMYTGELTVTPDNVQDLLAAADMLQLEEVKKCCIELLLKLTNTSNCLGMKCLGERYMCSSLVSMAQQVIKSRFAAVAGGEEFLQLSPGHLAQILSLDDLELGLGGEDTVLLSVLKWLGHSPDCRIQELRPLLEHVRLNQVSKEVFQTALDNSSLQQSPECVDYLRSVEEGNISGSDQLSVQRARVPTKYLYVLGGHSQSRTMGRNPTPKCERFNLKTQEWSDMRDLPPSMSCPHHIIAQHALVVDNNLYILNLLKTEHPSQATHYSKITYHMWKYSTLHDEWSSMRNDFQLPCLPQEFQGATVIHSQSDNLLYLVSSHAFLALDLDQDSCQRLPDFQEPKIYHGGAMLNGKLYVAGGMHTGSCCGVLGRIEVFSSMHCYDLVEKKWSEKASMLDRRAGMGFAELGGKLYAVGGYQHIRRLDSAEVYSPESDSWTYIASLHRSRTYCPLLTWNVNLYVVGGKSLTRKDGGARITLSSAEMYHPQTDCWSTIPAMKLQRCLMAAAVM
ncbi:kelch-like protein 12 isoform X1 [Branchiostoma floridae]|uniref:Kelch-like protein 12 isoform X1 n=2 Tax=Branchiostoma floridae TaxID=7739 RepID=A0A9J7HH52_BRAFL|nr:kelch-like protein 12 isoform X1 [Branchiostoma floridae]